MLRCSYQGGFTPCPSLEICSARRDGTSSVPQAKLRLYGLVAIFGGNTQHLTASAFRHMSPPPQLCLPASGVNATRPALRKSSRLGASSEGAPTSPTIMPIDWAPSSKQLAGDADVANVSVHSDTAKIDPQKHRARLDKGMCKCKPAVHSIKIEQLLAKWLSSVFHPGDLRLGASFASPSSEERKQFLFEIETLPREPDRNLLGTGQVE